MRVDRKARSEIERDWGAALPRLERIGPMTLSRRFDGLLISLVLDVPSSNVAYVPTCVLTLLTEPFDDLSLDVYDSLRSERTGGPDEVSIRGHAERHTEAAARMRLRFPWLDEARLSTSMVFDVLRAALVQCSTRSPAGWTIANPEWVIRGAVRLLVHAGANQTAERARRELPVLFAEDRRVDPARLATALSNVLDEKQDIRATIDARAACLRLDGIEDEGLVVDLP